MLSFIIGKIVTTDQQAVTIQTGGIGFSVQIPRSEVYQKGEEVTIITYLHWNQENGPSLFGFHSELERTVFLLIISCSGIGPKIGIALLATISAADFLQAVQTGNEKVLSSVSGIGQKKAEQMIVQLRHKVAKLIESGHLQESSGSSIILEQWKNIVQVFQSLNYSRHEIDAALGYLRKEYGGTPCGFDELLRNGLSFLAKRV